MGSREGWGDRWRGGVDRTAGVMVTVLRVGAQHYTCS